MTRCESTVANWFRPAELNLARARLWPSTLMAAHLVDTVLGRK